MAKLSGLTPLVVVFAVTTAAATDGRSGPVPVSHTITIVDHALIHPSALTMRSGDLIEFDNYSPEPMLLLFTDPPGSADAIRCRPVAPDAAAGDGPRREFCELSTDARLSAIIPPGRSATSCPLSPGRYAFVMRQVARDVPSADPMLGAKGTITVER